MHIGKKIKYLVEHSNLRMQDIALQLGKKSRQSLYNYYEQTHVSTELIEKLCKIFEVPITYFFENDQDYIIISEPVEEYKQKNNREKEWMSEKIRLLEENKALLEEKIKKCLSELEAFKTEQPV